MNLPLSPPPPFCPWPAPRQKWPDFLGSLLKRGQLSGFLLDRHLQLPKPIRIYCPNYKNLSISQFRVSACFQLAPHVLLPLTCPIAPAQLPVGHEDESMAQQLQLPSFSKVAPVGAPLARKCEGPPLPTPARCASRLLSPARFRARAQACQ
jgi:hypothetical protein